jgi:hypothetical protein
MRPTTRIGSLALALAVVAAAACSDSESAQTPTGSVSGDPVPVTLAGEAGQTSASTSPATVPATVTPGPASIATVPEEGVPGIDSDDPFCRAWSEFAGTFQALAFASFVGTDPEAALRLEVAASAALLAAADSIDAAFPDDVGREREAFVDGLLGPFTRRAERARDELVAAGLTDADLERLASLWLAALTEAGINDPALTAPVPDDLRAGFDAAVAAFGADVPSIGDDPSLVTDAAAPETEAYLAANCPDQGILGGNDVAG